MKRLTITVKIEDEGNYGLTSNKGEAEFRINYPDATDVCEKVLTVAILEMLTETANEAHKYTMKIVKGTEVDV